MLASLVPWALRCIFLICFHREKISRKKVVRVTIKGMNVNNVLVNEASLEN
jgi:hypothetical protein